MQNLQNLQESGLNLKSSIKEVHLEHHMRELIFLVIILADLVQMGYLHQYGQVVCLIIIHTI
nr:MAG TPA: hypothetical protein [Bacteriophage sp.]